MLIYIVLLKAIVRYSTWGTSLLYTIILFGNKDVAIAR